MPKEIGTAFDAEIGTVFCDDGDGAHLDVFFGGNLDWYLSIIEKGTDGLYRRNSIRVCNSGSAQPMWFSFVVAGMHAALKGDHERAAELLKGAAEHVVKYKEHDARNHNREG